ncbi:MAG: hypothetical protein QW714_00270 [Nanopusillaceae archaeon]
MVREVSYSAHCIYKHLAGACKGIKEFISKIGRVYTELLESNGLEEKDIRYIESILSDIKEILNELNDISWLSIKLEAGLEGVNNTDIAILVNSLTIARTRLEKIFIDWIRFLNDKKYPEEKMTPHFAEIHEVIADLYKAEQDHMPELLKIINIQKKEEV